MRSDYTHLTIVLDRSGSMASVQADIIGGFNRYLADQAKLPGRCTVTLVQFDTEYETVYNGVEIGSVTPRDGANYVPRGSTALMDAACRAIDETGAFLAGLAEAERPARVACVIFTDGHENASHEQTKADLVRRIKTQTDDFGWAFAYIGSDPATFDDARVAGVAAQGTAQFQHTSAGIGAVMDCLDSATRSYRSGASKMLNVSKP